MDESTPSHPDDAALADYVLEQLDEGEKARLEETLLADEELFERLLVVEDELVEAYVRGELPPGQRERVREHVLASPHGQEKLEFARTLLDSVNHLPRTAVPRRSWVVSLSGWSPSCRPRPSR